MEGIWIVLIAQMIMIIVMAVVMVSMIKSLGLLYGKVAKFQPTDSPSTSLAAGEIMPDVAFHTISGVATSTVAFKGVPTAFTVLSPDCAPCRDLLATLSTGDGDLTDLYPAKRRVVLSVGGTDATRNAMEQAGLSPDMPVFIASHAEIESQWGITKTPTTIVVTEDMTFIRAVVGFSARGSSERPPGEQSLGMVAVGGHGTES